MWGPNATDLTRRGEWAKSARRSHRVLRLDVLVTFYKYGNDGNEGMVVVGVNEYGVGGHNLPLATDRKADRISRF